MTIWSRRRARDEAGSVVRTVPHQRPDGIVGAAGSRVDADVAPGSGLRAARRVGTTLLALLVTAEVVGLAAYTAELVRRSNRRLSSEPVPAGSSSDQRPAPPAAGRRRPSAGPRIPTARALTAPRHSPAAGRYFVRAVGRTGAGRSAAGADHPPALTEAREEHRHLTHGSARQPERRQGPRPASRPQLVVGSSGQPRSSWSAMSCCDCLSLPAAVCSLCRAQWAQQ